VETGSGRAAINSRGWGFKGKVEVTDRDTSGERRRAGGELSFFARGGREGGRRGKGRGVDGEKRGTEFGAAFKSGQRGGNTGSWGVGRTTKAWD